METATSLTIGFVIGLHNSNIKKYKTLSSGILFLGIIALTQILVFQWKIIGNLFFLCFCIFGLFMVVMVDRIRREIRKESEEVVGDNVLDTEDLML